VSASLRQPRLRSPRGQATLESMIMMGFLLLMIFGLMHLVMFALTRYMVNYAAYAAARAAVVGNDPQGAAEAVMANFNWYAHEGGDPPVEVVYTSKDGASGYQVTTRVPFGFPIYEWIDPQGIELVAFAPVTAQDDAPSGGDND
jgi:hypothetical protein